MKLTNRHLARTMTDQDSQAENINQKTDDLHMMIEQPNDIETTLMIDINDKLIILYVIGTDIHPTTGIHTEKEIQDTHLETGMTTETDLVTDAITDIRQMTDRITETGQTINIEADLEITTRIETGPIGHNPMTEIGTEITDPNPMIEMARTIAQTQGTDPKKKTDTK